MRTPLDIVRAVQPDLASGDLDRAWAVHLGLGTVAGLARVLGLAILIYRRRTVGPVYSATTRNDKANYVGFGSQLHAQLAWLLIAMWPFTRLVPCSPHGWATSPGPTCPTGRGVAPSSACGPPAAAGIGSAPATAERRGGRTRSFSCAGRR